MPPLTDGPVACLKCGSHFETQLRPEPFGLNDRLRAYERASNVEEAQIDGFLTEIATEAERLDAELARMKAILCSLRALRGELDNKTERFRSLLAPIRKLPMDILAEIFLVDAQNTFSYDGSFKSPAVTLGRVCSFWHSVSTSNRQLWSNIAVNNDKVSASKFRHMLSLSKNAPLTLSIDVSGNDTSLRDLFVEACKVSQRWKSVKFRLSPECFATEACTTLRGQLPLLESASFSSWGARKYSSSLPHELNTAFEIAPKLREISTTCFRPMLLKLPWSQLTSFHGQGIQICDVLSVINSSSSLCHLSLCSFVGNNDSECYPVVSPSLTSLSLSGETHSSRCDRAVDALLKNLTLPALETLSISKIDAAASFCSFASRSLSTLTKLVLNRVGIPQKDLLVFFEPLASLRELTFHDYLKEPYGKTRRAPANAGADSLFEGMTARLSSDITRLVLPRLTHLDLIIAEEGPFDGFSDKIFLAMIKSRWSPGDQGEVARLKRVRVRILARHWLKKSADSLKKIVGQVRGQKLDIVVQGRRPRAMKPKAGAAPESEPDDDSD